MRAKIISGLSSFVLGLLLTIYGFYGSGVSADTIFSQEGYLAFGLSIIVGGLMIILSVVLFALAVFAYRQGS